jgi:hypothetical protein
MNRNVKIAISVVAVIAAVALVLFLPYRVGAFPEWRLRVVGPDGKPIAGAQVEQEWLDPIDEGVSSTDWRTSDGGGWVTFPARPLHHQLVNGTPRSVSNARVFTCWEVHSGEVLAGQLSYNGKNAELSQNLVATKFEECPLY